MEFLAHAIQFLSLVLLYLAATLALHSISLRYRPELSLLQSSVSICLLTQTIANVCVALCYPDLLTTSFDASVACFFTYQLFFFLGPATADRSLTAHFLMLLLDSPEQTLSQKEVLKRYKGDSFLLKRYDECGEAGLVHRRDSSLTLTGQGKLFARMYSALVSLYQLDQRSRWHTLFSTKS